MTITHEQLAALCRVAGWKQVESENDWFEAVDAGGYIVAPLASYDDAHALLTALVGKLGDSWGHSALNRELSRRWHAAGEYTPVMFGVRMSPESLCAAMFAALPECPACGGGGTDPTDSVMKCPACGGSGKAVKP